MKTAISVPDDTFERASARAVELGVSRSEFVATAAQHYLDETDSRRLTAQIDAAIDRQASADGSATDAVAAGRRVLDRLGNEW